jgi:hypothetical protein
LRSHSRRVDPSGSARHHRALLRIHPAAWWSSPSFGEAAQWELSAEADRRRRRSRKPDPTERVVRARSGLPSAGCVGGGSAANALAPRPPHRWRSTRTPDPRAHTVWFCPKLECQFSPSVSRAARPATRHSGPRGTSCCHDMNMLTHLLASLINSVEFINKASVCVSMQSAQQGSVHSTWLPATPGMHLLLCLSLTWIIGDFREPSIAVCHRCAFDQLTDL